MSDQSIENLIKEAANVFTEEYNFEKTIEEMGELLQAIQKYKEKKDIETYMHLYSELVDLSICVLVAKEFFEKNGNINVVTKDILKNKLDRFAGRVEAKKIMQSNGKK